MISKRNKTIDFNGYLLIGAIVFSPFTMLRIGYFGIPEILIIILFFTVIFRKKILLRLDFISFFWIFYIFLISIGLGNNYILKNNVSGNINTAIIDYLAYVFIFITSLTLCNLLVHKDKKYIFNVLSRSYSISSVLLVLLYLFGLRFSSLFGYSLFHYDNFRPLAENIHHVSMFLAPLPYIGLFILSNKKLSLVTKTIYVFLIVSNIYIGIQTGSTKILLVFLVASVILIPIYIYNKISSKKIRLLLTGVFAIIVFLVITLNFDFFWSLAISFFRENDGSSAREILYSSAIDKILLAPIFGYGPGAHANYFNSSIYSDAHQTFLTVSLQGGLIALILFIKLNIKLAKSFFSNSYIFIAYTAIMIYAMGGDILRRLPMWIFIILFYYYILKSNLEKRQS